MSSAPSKKTPGVVDHDTRLRHSLLGAILTMTMILVCASALFVLTGPEAFDHRATIPPLVMFFGILIQFQLWRMEKDTILAWTVVCTLTMATFVGSLVNGLRAPSTIGPLLTVLVTGYLLGKRAAWIVGSLSIAFLTAVYVANKLEWLGPIEPPSVVWARVIAIQLIASATTLLIPLRGLFSGIKLIGNEKIALEESMHKLDLQRVELAQEVERRTRELETANSDLAGFAYTLSNDLRAPLSSIDSYTRQLAATDGLGTRQKALVQRLRELSSSLDLDIDTAVHQARKRSTT
ncbi:MAG: hypothetical protein RL173_1992 [Fibrobacterota bacterium]|jgi:signal transduction histidine kinase